MLDLIIEKEVKAGVGDAVFKDLCKRFSQELKVRISDMLGKENGSVNLIFVDDARMQEINREHRGKNCTTDVISFAYLEGDLIPSGPDELVVGDIYISIDTASLQALDKGHSLKKEMGVLFVHGLLHLFGFDHNDDDEEAEMEEWACKVLS